MALPVGAGKDAPLGGLCHDLYIRANLLDTTLR
jgi:hypothetical protein